MRSAMTGVRCLSEVLCTITFLTPRQTVSPPGVFFYGDIMKLGSLFDGSGGFPLGGIIAGMTPVWSSEIEPFPIRVTEKRLPSVRHYGDVSKLNGAGLEPVEVVPRFLQIRKRRALPAPSEEVLEACANKEPLEA